MTNFSGSRRESSRLIKMSGWVEVFSCRAVWGAGLICPSGVCWSDLSLIQSERRRGSLAKLQVAMVKVKQARTRSMPRDIVCCMGGDG